MIPKNLKIIKTLGRGSYADVYLVLDVNTHKYYALKNLVINNKNSVKDITKEIEFYMMFNHPNIIKIYDYFVDKDEINILLEYAPYGTLEQYINKYKEHNKYLKEGKINSIILDLTKALKEIHSKGIIHRDLKPANILIGENQVIKLSDFGVCKNIKNKSYAVTMIGTPLYMSPEVVEGKKYNQSTDYWSLGCIVYEMIHLERLFNAVSFYQLFSKIKKFSNHKFNLKKNKYNKLLQGLLKKNYYFRYDYNDILDFLYNRYEILPRIKTNNNIKNKRKNNILNYNKKYYPKNKLPVINQSNIETIKLPRLKKRNRNYTRFPSIY